MLLGHMARTRGGLIDELVVYGDTALISRMIAR
jgi:hypothetical protein